MHHAYAIQASAEEGIAAARAWLARHAELVGRDNPDIVELRYGLFSVEDARRVGESAAAAPVAGEQKAVIIAASRCYREAQNALLKLFEEPPRGTYLFLILPTLGGLLPTLRSRVQILSGSEAATGGAARGAIAESARQFLAAPREKRSAIVKRLASGKDEDERRTNRDEALAIVDGIEAAAYAAGVEKHRALLAEAATFRGYLEQPTAPVRMILEHLAIVAPRLGSGQAAHV
ncbi:MAG: hypothetical protein KGI78_04095 [Patescibacteria group bacterium]|nr:hypothetical protein [Patescibacteria group bacterium]MDE1944575.1 hypothetical protein [Patescibacteria group bacterium]MDE1945425.1 hypothetical protein [Patescibacteria group bacterium]MDE2058001.1 hypothetical protein [Patescibacteria group bacterium]